MLTIHRGRRSATCVLYRRNSGQNCSTRSEPVAPSAAPFRHSTMLKPHSLSYHLRERTVKNWT